MFNLRNLLFDVVSFLRYLGLIARTLVVGPRRDRPPVKGRKWFERPGISSFFQTEHRQGYEWDRDYDKFNREISHADGRLNFQGPFCRAEEWTAFSLAAGVDHTVFQTKWHDGICFWDTQTTAWKTARDYTKEFADASRAAGIPFMFYYSSIFDHNPQHDPIQPDKHSTASLIGNVAAYREYMLRHYDELVTNYRPDGMWIDWYWAEEATPATIEHLRRKYPEQKITFNFSNLFPDSFGKIDFTNSEAHCYDGPPVRFKKEDALTLPVLTSSVFWANAFRQLFHHQWEVCAPTGRWWEDATPREDPNELLRSVAMVLACGGKFMIGVLVGMDGSLAPSHVAQWDLLGAWYKPRKHLFNDAAAFRYRWFSPPGVTVHGGKFDLVASRYDQGKLLHVINPHNVRGPIIVELRGTIWRDVKNARLMPQGKELPVRRDAGLLRIEVPAADVELVDTILYVA